MEILDQTIECENELELNRVLNEIKTYLEKADRAKINSVFTHLLVTRGLNHAYETLNHMRVRDILQLSIPASKPLVEGNEDGLRFRLFDPPTK